MCEVNQEWAYILLVIGVLLVAYSFGRVLISTLRLREEARRILNCEEYIDRLNNTQPDAVGYCTRPQYVLTRRRDNSGRLIVGKACVGYRYYNDGWEIPSPFDTKE